MQHTLWDACSRDFLFWINGFAWTYDPRKVASGQSPKIPFITWEYQDNAFLAVEESIGRHDILIEKSRDMGASWICLTTFVYRWLFRPRESYLMVSRKEALVDGTADSLFAHVDFILAGMPAWMRPNMKRMKLKLRNLDNGSVLDGESTNANLGRGGRRTAALIDEFASFEGGGWEVLSATADNTNCRIFNSTPNGVGNAFYAQLQKGTPRLRFHWTAHPEKGAGQYQDENGKWRSPWYDGECQRRASEVEIATQLDIDYLGSNYPFFDTQSIEELKREFGVPPMHVGSLGVMDGYPQFTEDDHGPMRVWVQLDEEGYAASDRDYIVGCDISQGTGASDSALSVVDRLTGEKVAEFCDNRVSVHRFAEIAVAVCRMFAGPGGRGAFLIWEATGPGRSFGKAVLDDCRYGNVYYRTDDQSVKKKVSDRPGWFSTKDGKVALLTNYRQALFSRKFINPSIRAMNQAMEFIYTPNGSIEHSGSSMTINPTDRGDSHGDVVIADALAAKLLREREVKHKPKSTQGPPVMSMAWRRQEHNRDLASASSGWD